MMIKRVLAFAGAACVLLCSFSAISVFAADDGGVINADAGGNNVTITVVVPDKPVGEAPPTPEETPAPPPEAITMYPSDVTETIDGGARWIVKTYELGAGENPSDIPRGGFARGGWRYTLTDILKKETANTETRAHTETVTVNTDSKELEQIMPLLTQTMEYKTDDGFVGVLSLDVSSIKVETAGTMTTSYTMTVTREYPHLSANDTSLVPKTVTDNGKTYTMSGVEWRAQRVESIDYEDVPTSYTAVASYSAVGTSTKVTGYVTTAVYSGSLAKLAQGKTVYTAYFIGEELRIPLEASASNTNTSESSAPTSAEPTAPSAPTPEPSTAATSASAQSGADNHGNNVLLVVILLQIATAGVLYFSLKTKKD